MKHYILLITSLLYLLDIHYSHAQLYTQSKAEKALQTYREELLGFRKEHPKKRNLPDAKFFFFGMGNRAKMFYKDGRIISLSDKRVIRRWKVKSALIVPSEYLVHLELQDGRAVDIQEDETGVYVYENNLQIILAESPITLPTFSDKKSPSVLRTLHHELLVNIQDGKPLVNTIVYTKPWFKSAAIITMALKKTNNLPLVEAWIKGLNTPFDRNNNAGYAEADNLGQVLYMLSTVADKKHPLVTKILDEADNFDKGGFIEGRTADMLPHPVYQTKWLKFGLKEMQLPDKYKIPAQYDSYSSLIWWDFQKDYVKGDQVDDNLALNSPQYVWAEDHFFKQNKGPISAREYPLTWEAEVTDLKYESLGVIDQTLVDLRIAPTNAWQAAEMLLLLLE